MLTYTPDENYILVANEGEPSDDYTNDPEGTISIINVNTEVVTTATFTSFNSDEASLETEGFRVFGPSATLAEDVEPEYITVDENSEYAYVTLQENNGIAKVNIASATVESILPLGLKDYTDADYDMTNEDGGYDPLEIEEGKVLGFYMPDAIASYTVGGATYLITANEGDAREYDAFEEEGIVYDDLDLTSGTTEFQDQGDEEDSQIGRLKTTLYPFGDLIDATDDTIYCFGGRSFSIWDENGDQVYDSGNDLAFITSLTGLYPDNRSDDKGTEPEGVATGEVNGRTLAFIGLERPTRSVIMVYDVSIPSSPIHLQTLTNTNDVAPEGLLFISEEDSPNGKALLVASHEVTGSIAVYQAD